MRKDRVIISGGGIGGLSAAAGLAQKGFASVVLEKASAMGEIGAGIQLGPNAFHAFGYFGVGDEARAIAVYVDKLVLMDGLSGAEITNIPVNESFRQRFRNPYAVVHRADLHGILLDYCQASPLVDLRTSHAVLGYQQDTDGVRVLVEDKDPVEGIALVGADGLHSPIRAQLVGDGAPKVSGHTTYRSVIATDKMPEDLRWNAATLWAGPKCHIVHYPLKGWEVFNLVVTYHNEAPEAVAGKPVPKSEVRRGFDHICAQARQVIEHGEDWKLWVLCDRDPTDKWVDGRVTLLGDAAHPMLQYMAQGACMAMEDAVCLSHMMEKFSGDIETTLPAYRDQRLPRTTRLQITSRLMGDHIYHPHGAAAIARDAVLKNRSAEEHYDSLAWLYGSNGLHQLQS